MPVLEVGESVSVPNLCIHSCHQLSQCIPLQKSMCIKPIMFHLLFISRLTHRGHHLNISCPFVSSFSLQFVFFSFHSSMTLTLPFQIHSFHPVICFHKNHTFDELALSLLLNSLARIRMLWVI